MGVLCVHSRDSSVQIGEKNFCQLLPKRNRWANRGIRGEEQRRGVVTVESKGVPKGNDEPASQPATKHTPISYRHLTYLDDDPIFPPYKQLLIPTFIDNKKPSQTNVIASLTSPVRRPAARRFTLECKAAQAWCAADGNALQQESFDHRAFNRIDAMGRYSSLNY